MIKEEDERSDSDSQREDIIDKNSHRDYTDDELSEDEMVRMQSGLLGAINSFESQFKCTAAEPVPNLKI